MVSVRHNIIRVRFGAFFIAFSVHSQAMPLGGSSVGNGKNPSEHGTVAQEEHSVTELSLWLFVFDLALFLIQIVVFPSECLRH